MTDIFIEFMVTKKPDRNTWLARLGIAMGIVVIPYVMLILSGYAEFLSAFMLPVFAGCIWGGVILWRRLDLEFEYILTDGALDVDKIIGKRSRKRLLSVDASAFEILAPMTEKYKSQYESQSIAKTIDASTSKNARGRWFVIFKDKDGKRTLLIFEPNSRMIDAFKMKIRSKMGQE